MILRVFLTVFEILLVVGILAFFLNRVAAQLNSISRTCAKIAFGVRAVETQCAVIGPAAERINSNLTDVISGLESAAVQAERLLPR
jgi:hypothetical protein